MSITWVEVTTQPSALSFLGYENAEVIVGLASILYKIIGNTGRSFQIPVIASKHTFKLCKYSLDTPRPPDGENRGGNSLHSLPSLHTNQTNHHEARVGNRRYWE